MKGYEWKPLSKILDETPDLSATDALEEKYPLQLGIGLWCRFFLTTSLLNQIQGIISVVHGPLGCIGSVRTFWTNHWGLHFGHPFFHMPCTSMGDQEVILGGEEKLENTLREVDARYRPQLIVVTANCCAGLNMDDIPAVIDAVKHEINARVYFINCYGFTGCNTNLRSWLMPHFVELMDEPKEIVKGAVNIIGLWREIYSTPKSQWRHNTITDVDELARYVEMLGLKVHRVLFSGDYDYLRTAPEAEVNAMTCPAWGIPLGKAMRQKFGTPLLQHGRPIGVEATIAWIRELAHFMKIENGAESLIAQEYRKIKDIWEEAKKLAKGKIALIEGSRNSMFTTVRALAQARFSMELGMIPYIFNSPAVMMKGDEDAVRYFIEQGCNPLTLDGPYEHGSALKAEDIRKDLGLKHEDIVYFPNDVFDFASAGRWDKSNVAAVQDNQPFRRVKGCPRNEGFKGALGLARDVIKAIKGARRKDRATFYGRLYGKEFDFEETGEGKG